MAGNEFAVNFPSQSEKSSNPSLNKGKKSSGFHKGAALTTTLQTFCIAL